MSKKKTIDLRNGEEIKKHRENIRLPLTLFWNAFGVNTRTAYRYENGQDIGVSLLILINMVINKLNFEEAGNMFITTGPLTTSAARNIKVHKVISGEKK